MKEGTLNLALIAGIGLVIVYLIVEAKNLFNSSAATSVANTTYNAATGTLTQNQQDALITQEAQQLVQASGGTLSMSDALAQAKSDTSKALAGAPTYWQAVKDEFSNLGDWLAGN